MALQACEFSAWVQILWTSGHQKPTDNGLYVSNKKMLTSTCRETENGAGMKSNGRGQVHSPPASAHLIFPTLTAFVVASKISRWQPGSGGADL